MIDSVLNKNQTLKYSFFQKNDTKKEESRFITVVFTEQHHRDLCIIFWKINSSVLEEIFSSASKCSSSNVIQCNAMLKRKKQKNCSDIYIASDTMLYVIRLTLNQSESINSILLPRCPKKIILQYSPPRDFNI